MPKPFTRAQALQNRAFLRALERTGNTHIASEATGLARSTMNLRRRTHPAFAQAWDAAVAAANARLRAGGRIAPQGNGAGSHRTKGGELVVTRGASGRFIVRRSPVGNLTRTAEQAFLSALSATANIKLSAAAAGAPHQAFYRRRDASPAFAREMRLALEAGYERIETALLASASPASHDHDDWRHNAPPEMPPMTVNQALQLLYLHQKQALMLDEPPHTKRRRGESRQAHLYRMAAMHEATQQRQREKVEVAEAARRERGEPSLWEMWEATKAAVDLAQVQAAMQARSAARRKTSPARPAGRAANPSDDAGCTPASGLREGEDRALFGGWRIGDMKARKRDG